jgi:PST family polysaccharide transporter
MNFRKILVNSSWLIADRFIRLGVGLLVGGYVARFLGPVSFGILNYALTLINIAAPLSSLGIENVVVKELTQSPAHKNEIIQAAFFSRVLGGILGISSVIAAVYLLRPGDAEAHLIALILACSILFQPLDVIDLWFQSQFQSKFTVYIKSLAFLLTSALRIWLVWSGAQLWAFALAYTAEVAAGSLGLLVVYKKGNLNLVPLSKTIPWIKRILGFSWPLMLAIFVNMVYLKMDIFIVAKIGGDYMMGIYSAASRISELWYFVPTILSISFFPAITESRNLGEKTYLAQLGIYMKILGALGFLMALTTSVFSWPIINGIFGPQFSSAAKILAIHVWSLPFLFLGTAQAVWLINEGRTVFALARTLVGLVSNILLNLLLVPVLAGVGAAISLVISQIISNVLTNLLLGDSLPIFGLQIRALWIPGSCRELIAFIKDSLQPIPAGN